MHSSSPTYSIRTFFPSEAEQYKAIRLEALQLEAGVFGSSYAREAAFSDEEWLARLTSSDSVNMGLYHENELIGITGVVVDREDVTRGIMVQSYIRKPYRGNGLSHLFMMPGWTGPRKRD
jgi:hypothetical protein